MFSVNLTRKAIKDLKSLRNKFPKITEDLDKLFSILSQEKIIGDRIQNLKGLEIYKARLRNSSSTSGSSGGFRIIYYIKRKNGQILVLTIYSKTQKNDISHTEILKIIKQENLV